jgi:hypothetical protein
MGLGSRFSVFATLDEGNVRHVPGLCADSEIYLRTHKNAPASSGKKMPGQAVCGGWKAAAPRWVRLS